MAIVHMSRPSGSGFFVFPIDESTAGTRAAHDTTRVVALRDVESYLSAATATLLRPRVGSAELRIVGLRPDGSVEKKWDLVVGGETVFFLRGRKIVAHGTIIHAERSNALAARLFGASASSHELLLFLVDVTSGDFDLERFNRAAGRAERSAFKSFTNLSAANVRSLEQNYGSVYGLTEAISRPRPAADAVPRDDCA